MLIMTAKSIMDVVRAFYAGHGPKSCNKVYMKSKKEIIGLDEFEQKRTSMLVKMFSSAQARRRNKNVKVSGDMRMKKEEVAGMTPYQIGEHIWRKGEGGQQISGNCGEMAFVSAYLAIADYHIASQKVWYAGIGAPGDHAFCVLGPEAAPTWATAKEMQVYGGESSSAVIVDPWLHVACHAINYPEFAAQTLKKWHRAGKRVAWSGKDFDGVDESTARDGWYDPSGTYSTAFLTSPLSFNNAMYW